MIEHLARRAPASMIRWLGRAQYRYPWMQRWIQRLAQSTRNRPQRMRHGIGVGLWFNPEGGNPGYALGTSDQEEQALLSKMLEPGDVFYDIGANKGFFSVLGSTLVGDGGQVYAFEPDPQSAVTTRKNLQRNGLNQAQVYETAIGERSGQATFVTEGESVHFHLQNAGRHTESSDAASIEVQVATLDQIRHKHQLAPPRLIKIDVEGAEIDLLRGAVETIGTHRPAILCEVHWLGDEFSRYVTEHIEPLGYRIRTIAGQPLPDGPVRYHALMTPDERH